MLTVQQQQQDEAEQEPLAPLYQALRECQAAVDEATRASLCAPSLAVTAARLKLECDQFAHRWRAAGRALDEFTAATETLFETCEQAYATLYLKMYQALGNGGGAGGGGGGAEGATGPAPAKLRTSGVAIEPASALNVVLSGAEEMGWPGGSAATITEPLIRVSLYNDNETLIKMPQSNLASGAVPQADAVVIELERFFLQHCDTLQEYYLEYENLLSLPGPLSLLRLRLQQTALAMRGGCAALDASGGVVAALGRLCDQTDTLYLAREQACSDCRLMRDNASAKWLEAVRLKDNMLRAYYLTRLHQPPPDSSSSSSPSTPPSMASIF